MSAIYPASEDVIHGFTPDGKAIVQTKNHEMPVRFAGLVEVANKKVSKEIQREKSKVEGYRADMMETTEGMIGASPADSLSSTIAYVDPRAMWTPKERKSFRDFMQLHRKWVNEVIPIEKQALREKLLNRYGTIHADTYEKLLNVQMQSDARLVIRTRRGIVKTTVEANRVFHASKASGSEGRKS